MNPWVVSQLVVLLALANGAPVAAKWLLGDHFATPLDAHVTFIDGRALLGQSKTIRGLLAALAATLAGAWCIGLEPGIGLRVAAGAMAGDLLSSFIKRRLGLAPSSRAIGLDQIPESLIPLIACRKALSLTLADIATATVIFCAGEMVLSPLLYRLRMRDKPY